MFRSKSTSLTLRVFSRNFYGNRNISTSYRYLSSQSFSNQNVTSVPKNTNLHSKMNFQTLTSPFSFNSRQCQLHMSHSRHQERIVQSPPFAESVSEGDIRWEKSVGDTVAEDEHIGEIETDKTSVPVLAPCAGVITELLVADGEKVVAKQNLYKIKELAAGSAPPPAVKSAEKTPEKAVKSPQPAAATPKPAEPVVKSQPAKVVEATTDPNWTSKKVEAPKNVEQLKVFSQQESADSGAAVAGDRSESRIKMNRMRKRISQRLKEAQNTAAMLTTFNEIDMSNIFELRERYKDHFLKRHGVKLGFMSAFCKGSALALSSMPEVNGVIDNEDIVYRNYVDISIAVSTPKGLVVPVLRNVEKMNFAQIEIGINELGERARNNQLAVEDMDGGTFTISNGGVFGSLFGTPIINPPQSAILGLHGIFQRPVVVSGTGASAKIEARPMMYVALTYDHRLIDGREAVTFLRKIKSFIEDPRVLLLDL